MVSHVIWVICDDETKGGTCTFCFGSKTAQTGSKMRNHKVAESGHQQNTSPVKFFQTQLSPFPFATNISHYQARGIALQLCRCRQNVARSLGDFEANSIVRSLLLCCLIRLGHGRLVLFD